MKRVANRKELVLDPAKGCHSDSWRDSFLLGGKRMHACVEASDEEVAVDALVGWLTIRRPVGGHVHAEP